MNTIEEWRPVIGFEHKYAVSSLGRVKRLSSVALRKAGDILHPSCDSDGYLVLTFTISKRIRRNYKVHRLVAGAFLPNGFDLPQVNHLDGNKKNNSVSNLEWSSVSNNIRHAYKLNLMVQQGERNNASKLTLSQVDNIRSCHRTGVGVCKIAKLFNVSHSLVSMIVSGKMWASQPEKRI